MTFRSTFQMLLEEVEQKKAPNPDDDTVNKSNYSARNTTGDMYRVYSADKKDAVTGQMSKQAAHEWIAKKDAEEAAPSETKDKTKETKP